MKQHNTKLIKSSYMYLCPCNTAFSGLISVYMSPFTGGATGVPRTTAPSGPDSVDVCLVRSSYLTGARPACKFVAAAPAAA